MRWLLLVLGTLFAGLAVIGAFLPILPTTPFLLVAGACLVRSSPSMHAKLKRMPIFGVYLHQWERDRSIPASAKRKAYTLIALTLTYSIWAANTTALRITLAAIAAILIVALAKAPTTDDPA